MTETGFDGFCRQRLGTRAMNWRISWLYAPPVMKRILETTSGRRRDNSANTFHPREGGHHEVAKDEIVALAGAQKLDGARAAGDHLHRELLR